jgi:hypothetical protein
MIERIPIGPRSTTALVAFMILIMAIGCSVNDAGFDSRKRLLARRCGLPPSS